MITALILGLELLDALYLARQRIVSTSITGE